MRRSLICTTILGGLGACFLYNYSKPGIGRYAGTTPLVLRNGAHAPICDLTIFSHPGLHRDGEPEWLVCNPRGSHSCRSDCLSPGESVAFQIKRGRYVIDGPSVSSPYGFHVVGRTEVILFDGNERSPDSYGRLVTGGGRPRRIVGLPTRSTRGAGGGGEGGAESSGIGGGEAGGGAEAAAAAGDSDGSAVPEATEPPATESEPTESKCQPDGSEVSGSRECCSGKTYWNRGWVCCSSGNDCT
jgi:hypothetical protein